MLSPICGPGGSNGPGRGASTDTVAQQPLSDLGGNSGGCAASSPSPRAAWSWQGSKAGPDPLRGTGSRHTPVVCEKPAICPAAPDTKYLMSVNIW